MDLIRIQARSDFGKRLKQAIAKAGLKQYQLAEMVGVEPANVSRWATGKHFPDSSHFLKLCEILKVDENYFLNPMNMAGLAKLAPTTESKIESTIDKAISKALEVDIEILHALKLANEGQIEAIKAILDIDEDEETTKVAK